MFRTPLIRSLTLAAVVGSLAAGAAPAALAQQAEDRIVVTPSIRVDRDRDRFGEQSVSVSREVTTAGLDLRYEGDVSELHRRVATAAELACHDAEMLIEDSLTSDRECEREARRGASRQIEAAVERHRYYRY